METASTSLYPRNSANSPESQLNPTLTHLRNSLGSHSGKHLTSACLLVPQLHICSWPENGKGDGALWGQSRRERACCGKWEVVHVREQSGRWNGERKGRGMVVKRENSGTSSHVLKKMSCQAGLDNYCHLGVVSVQENQIIMMS